MSRVVWGMAPASVPAVFRVAALGLSATALLMVMATAGLAQTPTTTLPTLKVEAKKQQPRPVKKAARKRKAPPKAEPETAPPPAETAFGPVKGYIATRSATGTKTDTPLAEVPQSISVVGREQMRDTGVQTLQETLRYMPGLVPDGFGLDSRGDFVLIRGIEADFFLDGLRTAYGFYAHTIGAEPYGLERVEVLRGPSSMLYGQSSTGGIVNMVSKRPQAFKHGEIGFDYGSYNFGQMKMDVGGPLTADGKWLYRFVGLARDAETQVDFVDNDRVYLAPSLTYRPSKDTSITLLGRWQEDHGGSVQQFLPHAGTLFPNKNGKTIDTSTFIGEPTDYNDTEQKSVTLLVDHELFPGLTLHHGTRYTDTHNTYDTHYTAPLTAGLLGTLNGIAGAKIVDQSTAPFLDSDQEHIARVYLWRDTETDVLTSDTNLTGTFLTGALAHKMTGGVDYTRFATGGTDIRMGGNNLILVDNLYPLGTGQTPFNIYDPAYGQTPHYISFPDGTPYLPGDIPKEARPDETQTQTGIYIQDQIKLGQWSAVLGLRKDWLTIEADGTEDVAQSATTGRAALMYHFKSGLSPYISYSQAFAAQPGNRVLVPTCTPVGSDACLRPAEPLEGEQVEVGFKYQPPGLPFMISAAVFDLTEKNRLEEDVLAQVSRQGETVRIRGFELQAAAKLTENLKVVGAYTYNDGEYTDHFNAFEIGTSVWGLPDQTASLWGIYTFHDGPLRGLSLGAGVRYVGESRDYGMLVTGDVIDGEVVPDFGEVVTPSFTLFDAMVAYETENWRWQLTGTNLEDEFHVISCGTRGDCGVGQGRTVLTSFTYKF